VTKVLPGWFPTRNSLQGRLFWILGGLSLGILLIINMIWLPSAIVEIQDAQSELRRVAVQGLRDQIKFFLEETEQDLTNEAQLFSVPFLEGDQADLTRLAYRLLKRQLAVEEVGIVDERGQERFRLSRRVSFTDRDLRDLSTSALFQEGLQQGIYWGPVVITETSEPRVTLAVPLRRSGTAVPGLLYTSLTLKSLWGLVGAFSLSYGGRAYVVDHTGRLIAAGDPSLVLKQLSFIDRAMIRELVVSSTPDGLSFSQGTYTNENKADVMATGLSLSGPDWAVVVEQPKSLLYAPIRRKLWSFAGVFFIGLAISFGLARVLSRRFTRPILELREGVEHIGRGHLEHKVVVNTSDEIESLASDFNEMARVLKESYRSLETKIAERTRDLSALYAALAPLGSSDQLLQQIVERLKEATHADAVLVRIFDKETKSFLYFAAVGFPSNYLEGTRDPKQGSAVTAVFMTGEPIISANIVEDPRLKGKRQLDAGFRSCAFLPLRVSGELRGVLHLASREVGHFSNDKTEHLMAIARHMGIAMENRELFQETERRAQEQEVLNTVAMATSQSLHLDEILQIALEKVLDVTGREQGYIRLKDPVTGKLRLAAHRGLSREYIEVLLHRRTPGGKGDQVFESGEVLVINDPQAVSLKEETRREGRHSLIWVPLKARGKVVGLLNVTTNRPIPFALREVELLQTIGNVIGVALENARLFGETKSNLERVKALQEIDKAITSTLDLHTVLDVLMEKIDVVLPYSATTVRLFNKASGLLDPVACRNLDEGEWKAGQWTAGRGPANTVFEAKAPLMIRNCYSDRRVRDPEFFRKHGLVSYLGVPMVAKEEILGVLSFYTKEEHEYTSEEVDFLTTLAGQAAVAIHNSQLYEQARTRERELQETNRMLSALHEVAAAASEALDLDRVLQAAIEKITEIFRFDATRIHVYDARTDEMVLRASFESDPDRFTPARSFKRGQGIVGKVAESGKPLIFENIQTDPLYQQLSHTRVSDQFGYLFFAVFPVKGKLKNLGTVGCVSTAARKLNLGEIQLLEAIADRIAVAIENRVLYEQLRQNVRELQQKTAELEAANKVKDEFLSVMSHELRTPLNVVVGYTEMIKDGMLGETNPKQSEALEKIMARTGDLLTMITSILNATSIETHRVQCDNRQFALIDFLGELRASYERRLDKPLTLSWNYPSDLPVVETDQEKLKCILQNLISNAIKFTDSGYVAISVRIKQDAGREARNSDHQQANGGNEKTMEFKVEDTGIGIPQDKLPVIFEKFRQVDSSETRLYGGVGLGLYIAKNFAELLGGKIWVGTEVGKGSMFTVSVPCAVPPSEMGSPQKETSPAGFIDSCPVRQ
jgi:GAF domain-containing protein